LKQVVCLLRKEERNISGCTNCIALIFERLWLSEVLGMRGGVYIGIGGCIEF
jgi:hypothetical protein